MRGWMWFDLVLGVINVFCCVNLLGDGAKQMRTKLIATASLLAGMWMLSLFLFQLRHAGLRFVWEDKTSGTTVTAAPVGKENKK